MVQGSSLGAWAVVGGGVVVAVVVGVVVVSCGRCKKKE